MIGFEAGFFVFCWLAGIALIILAAGYASKVR